ncbi:MAG: SIMPL domain-containing protein [Candidatus Omnitrophica bacterium]|nr:SIMPL domain-containing protein [Candidatus Omnitrophota bacterium]
MEKKSLAFALTLGLCIGLGIAIAGIYLGISLKQSRRPQSVVSVRGLAERDVDADLAIWPITFQETSDDLTDLYNRITGKRKIVSRFLTDAGFSAEEISYSAPSIVDLKTRAYGNESVKDKPKYMAEATVTLRSTDVARVKKTIEQSGSLVGKGIVLVASNWENRTQYLFKGLNNIKPEMIEEATKNARAAAEKFAEDSESKLGKISSASQGLFDITDRDQGTPEKKTVRVVTYVSYFLAD